LSREITAFEDSYYPRVHARAAGTHNPSGKSNPSMGQLQAITNLTDVLKLIAIVLIDIRDGKESD
jgi:hypothetical protein